MHRFSTRSPRGLGRLALAALACLLLARGAEAGLGGPDAAGYEWYDANDGCPYEADDFLLLNRTGFWQGSLVNNLGPFDLGFDFPFYDITTRQVWINRGGLLLFEPPPDMTFSLAQPIPTLDSVGGFLAPYWDEWDAASQLADSVTYEQFPGYFKLTWNAKMLSSGVTVLMEAYLYPNGAMRTEYLTVGVGPFAGAIGIEAPDQATGLQLLHAGGASGGLTYGNPTPFSICFEPPALLDCGPGSPLPCGITNGASPASVAVPVSGYGCNLGPWDGNEAVYQLTLTEVTDLDVTLAAGDRGKAVFLLGSCSERDCISGGGISASATTLGPGTYTVVVDAARPLDEGPFTLDVACNSLSTPIACEGTRFDTTLGGQNRFAAHDCVIGDFSGPEVYYSVDFPGPPGNINVTLGSAFGHAAFIYQENGTLEGASCLQGGVGGMVLYDPPAGRYVIVVDGPPGSDGDFSISVNCAPEIRCAPGAGVLECNSTIAGDTSLLPSFVDFYRCTSFNYSGPEAVYTFVNPMTQVISFVLDSLDDRLDLLVLTSCNEGACLEVADTALDQELPAGTYYVVVDGRDGAAGPYTLTAICGNTIEPATIFINGAEGECFNEHKRAWLTPDIPRADVLFSIDLTGSMGAERARLQVNMQDIIDRLRVFINDVAFGLVSYKDYQATGAGTVPCAYTADGFGGGGDYPYRLHQPITTDRVAIQGAVNLLPAATGGADGPESYSRVLFEAVNDGAIGWRPGARRLLVDFGDEMPHDCNVLECLGAVSPQNRGVDLGRDGAPGGGDDITILDAVQGLSDARIAMVHLDSSGGGTDGGYTYTQIWDCWARLTGGSAVALNSDGSVPGGLDLAELIGDVIQQQGSFCPTLELVAEPGFEAWLSASVPTYFDIDLPTAVEFDITICVPPGTPSGTYTFEVQLLCGGGVVVAQQVTVDVVVDCRPSVVSGPAPQTICRGDMATLDASGMSLVNCGGAIDYLWFDDVGAPIGSGQMLMVSPSVTSTYRVDVVCSVEPGCRVSDTVTVTVHDRPVFDLATGQDINDCNLGIELSWPSALFPSGSGVYNVYRSEVSCADAVTRGPIAENISVLGWIDWSTRPAGVYYYVVEAEDSLPASACLPRGPVFGGATTRSCIDPPIPEVGTATFPEGVFTTLFARHVGQEITLYWDTARPLLLGETFRMLKAIDEPSGFVSVNGTMDVSRAFTETDVSSPHQFFDLRVANACEDLSRDEYPPSYP